MPKRRKIKLSIKIGVFMIVLMAVSLSILATVLIISQRNKLTEDVKSNGKVFAEFTAQTFYQTFLNNRFEAQVEQVLNEALEKNNDIQNVSLISTNGKVQFEKKRATEEDSYQVRVGKSIEDPTTLEFLISTKFESRDLEIDGEEFIEMIVPLTERSGAHLFSMRYLISYESLIENSQQIYTQTVITIVPMLVLVSLISIPFSIRLTKPLVELTGAADKVRTGNFDVNIDIKSSDEIGTLANAFNQMTRDLKKSKQEIENYSKTLENQVNERTKELGEKMVELERFSKLTKDRELKMDVLQKEYEDLQKKVPKA